MRTLRIWLTCSLFTVAIVCPDGYVLKDEKCYKKPPVPVVTGFKVTPVKSKEEKEK